MVDGFAGGIGSRAHKDNHAIGIFSTVVGEEMVLSTGDLGNLAKVLLHHFGHIVIVAVASLTMGEERLGILGGTSGDRTLRGHGALAEALDVFTIHQRTDVLLVHDFHLVVLMRCAETVEEIDERHTGLEGSQVGNSRHIHHLLHGTFAKHGEARLTAGHHVLVVAENTKGM